MLLTRYNVRLFITKSLLLPPVKINTMSVTYLLCGPLANNMYNNSVQRTDRGDAVGLACENNWWVFGLTVLNKKQTKYRYGYSEIKYLPNFCY